MRSFLCPSLTAWLKLYCSGGLCGPLPLTLPPLVFIPQSECDLTETEMRPTLLLETFNRPHRCLEYKFKPLSTGCCSLHDWPLSASFLPLFLLAPLNSTMRPHRIGLDSSLSMCVRVRACTHTHTHTQFASPPLLNFIFSYLKSLHPEMLLGFSAAPAGLEVPLWALMPWNHHSDGIGQSFWEPSPHLSISVVRLWRQRLG